MRRPGSAIVCDALGQVVAGPMRHETGWLEAEIDVDLVRTARQRFGVCGHYSRPDLFPLTVNRTPRQAVTFHERG